MQCAELFNIAGQGAIVTGAGSGLGLAIAQSIARRHHATITLGTSNHLGGLLVTVRFPASKARSSAA